jgi:hypothetical protein
MNFLFREHVRTYHFVHVNYVVMFVTNNGLLTLYGTQISSSGSRSATFGPCGMKRNPSATNCLCLIIGFRITDCERGLFNFFFWGGGLLIRWTTFGGGGI